MIAWLLLAPARAAEPSPVESCQHAAELTGVALFGAAASLEGLHAWVVIADRPPAWCDGLSFSDALSELALPPGAHVSSALGPDGLGLGFEDLHWALARRQAEYVGLVYVELSSVGDALVVDAALSAPHDDFDPYRAPTALYALQGGSDAPSSSSSRFELGQLTLRPLERRWLAAGLGSAAVGAALVGGASLYPLDEPPVSLPEYRSVRGMQALGAGGLVIGGALVITDLVQQRRQRADARLTSTASAPPAGTAP